MNIASPYDIENYLHSRGLQFRRRGRKAELRICPFCQGGDRNDLWKCVVYLDQSGGNYKCMRGSCNATGTFWGLMEHFGDDPKEFHARDERQKRVAKKTGIQPALRPVDFTFPKHDVEPSVLTDEAKKYLLARGFSEETMDDVAVWCDEQGMINFGYYHKGECCMVKVRHAGKAPEGKQKAWQKWKGGLRTLWGLEQVDFSLGRLVITFGEYDRIALRQARIPNVVSVPCGDNDLEWINVCWDELQKFPEIVLWCDNDKSGQECLAKIADRLGKERIRVVKSQYKDANEFLLMRQREVGEEVDEELYDAVMNADWYFAGDLVQLADVKEAEQEFDGYLSGIRPLDKALGGFFRGQLILHVGDNKHGKSAGVNQVTAMAIEGGGKVCAWPGEDRIEDYKYKMYTHIGGYPGMDARMSERTGTEYAVLKQEYKDATDEWLRDRLVVLDSRTMMNEETLIENFTLAYQRFGCDVFIVDNLMKLVTGKETENVYFRQAQICNALSNFAKDRKVTVHLVSHTNKSGPDNEPPTKKSVSGAKEIVNLCDRLISWWRIPDSEKGKYGNMESLISVLADRTFGNESTHPVRYHNLIKRYGDTMEEMTREYSLGLNGRLPHAKYAVGLVYGGHA